MSIPEDSVAEVLSRSARHCCICRQFQPLQIQVHHIIERSNGGTNEVDNLIPICISCHSSVHTKTQMTRGFTANELKRSRDNVYDLVSCGKLPAKAPLSTSEIQSLSEALSLSLLENNPEKMLSKMAVEILTRCIIEDSSVQVIGQKPLEYYAIFIADRPFFTNEKISGQYPSFIIELLSSGYLESKGSELEVTAKGIEFVESIVPTTETFVEKKAKCVSCGMHFIMCTWHDERHNASNIHCPECGQSDGNFLVWSEKKFGLIFQDVPGKANLIDMPSSLIRGQGKNV
ncbi:HNH endonuclease [Pseudoalteromonas peptidolytica]|uniref:HNH endonuclease n=1 Tax=Pseudoalteromonas peptidolytica TaxID=61150 RepID=UPI00298EA725|nr:HNH endonuclease signature motif containing protein [Pseudoalteromonas peptidolytica]MDW7551543.1 HNH endonuclease signature motif containing protein [Pseudoalteromonas peptidolytica]